MKNVFKVLGIIALVAVIGFSMVSCEEETDNGGGGKKELSGTLTAKEYSGLIFFNYSGIGNCPDNLIFTTDLPAPNNSIIVDYQVPKSITVTPDQKVKWTVKVDKGSLFNVTTANDGANTVRITWKP